MTLPKVLSVGTASTALLARLRSVPAVSAVSGRGVLLITKYLASNYNFEVVLLLVTTCRSAYWQAGTCRQATTNQQALVLPPVVNPSTSEVDVLPVLLPSQCDEVRVGGCN